MSWMPHSPGGILPPLTLLMAQKKVAPADMGCNSKNDEVPDTNSGSRTSSAKSLHRAEALLHTHLYPVRKSSLYEDSEAACFDDSGNEEDLVPPHNYSPSSASHLEQVERSLIGLNRCLTIQKDPGADRFNAFFKQSFAESSTTEFYYHPACASVVKHGSRLYALTQQRHYLKLAKDYAIRLKGTWDFTQKLSALLVSQRAAGIERSPSIQSGQLKTLCEDLRKHTSHWSILQKTVRQDRWLQPLLLQKQGMLTRMKTSLSLLAYEAIKFTELYIDSTLRSLGRASATSFSPDELSDIFRGLEIYNQVVSNSAVIWELAERRSDTCEVSLTVPGLKDALERGGSHGRVGAYPIARVLSIVSEARGQQTADCLHWALLQQDEFLSSVRSCPSTVDWKKANVPSFHNIRPSIVGSKPRQTTLSTPRIIECHSMSQLCASRQLEAICTEDEHVMGSILDVLVSSTDTFWHHFLNKPKPDRPHSAEGHSGEQQSQDASVLLVTNGDLDGIHAEERLDMQGCRGLTRRLFTPTSEAVGLLYTRYRVMLWNEFSSCLFDRFYGHPVAASVLPSLSLCKEGASMAVVQILQDLLKNSSVPEECVLEGWNLCLHLLSQAVLICWDQEFCRALGSGLNDKCVPDPSGLDGPVRSRTAGLLLKLFPALCFLLECLHLRALPDSVPGPVLPCLRLAVLSRCLATLQSTSSWVMTKAHRFLASWSLNQFLLVTQADLPLLMAEIERMTDLVGEACPGDVMPHAVQRAGMSFQVAQLCLQIHAAAASIQRFSREVLQLFSDDCRRMSADLFLQTMPAGKNWRLRRRADVPNEPSEYATAAMQAVIGQVLQGIHPLPQDSQIAALAQVVAVFMEAWMDHILQQKIKFSLHGALQLKQDFDSVRDMIQDSNLSEAVRQAILSQRVFQNVDNAIICLLQQPSSKNYMPSTAWHPLRNCCSCSCSRHEDFNSGSLNSLESLDIQTARNGAMLKAQTSATADLLSKMRSSSNTESYLTMNQQEWLSLRLHAGRRWRVLCLPCGSRTPET